MSIESPNVLTDSQPSYFAILPASVRYDKNIISSAKLLYGEITALSNATGYCWAGDGYFASLYSVDKRTIQRWLGSLERQGYITREVVFKDGSKEVDKRFIRLASDPNLKNMTPNDKKVMGGGDKKVRTLVTKKSEPYRQKSQNPIDKKVRDNNTSNKTINSTSNTSASSEEAESQFNQLWQKYPRKKNKSQAFQSYLKAIENGTLPSEIETGLNNYLKEIKLQGTASRFIKLGFNWFKEESWQDDYDTQQQGSRVREVLPEWAQDDYKYTGEKATPEQIAKVKAQIEAQRKGMGEINK